MATLKDIKNRIVSVKKTQQITKAMKMVSAAKLRRAQQAVANAKPYSGKLSQIVSNLSAGLTEESHPLLKKNGKGKILIILITSDKGLCGSINTGLCKKIANKVSENEEVQIIPVGKKGLEFFERRNVDFPYQFKELKDREIQSELVKLAEIVIKKFVCSEFREVFLAYNEFETVLTQNVQINKILPIEATEQEEASPDTEWVFEPNKEEILNSLLPKYVKNRVYTAMLDNVASEHASRMTAMDAATNNASDMISALQLQYNRARQAVITKELIEIISGAESIN